LKMLQMCDGGGRSPSKVCRWWRRTMPLRWRRAVHGLSAFLAAALLLSVSVGRTDAKTFRWANDGDANSMDPYARQETFLLAFAQNMYEPLIRRSRDMRLEPGLATKWTRTEPTVWRLTLRQGVKFHDGS